jgi:group I intron endonuclease
MYHFIYQTTNLVTNKYYIGMHSTEDLNDGYLGSGIHLKASVNKYGKDAHQRHILEFANTREELCQLEMKLIDEQLLSDSRCMNLTLGGVGGPRFGVRNGMFGKKNSDETKRKISIATSGDLNGFYGRKHSESAKEKMSVYRTGKTMPKDTKDKIAKRLIDKIWIYNPSADKCKRVVQDELESYKNEGWILGRKACAMPSTE